MSNENNDFEVEYTEKQLKWDAELIRSHIFDTITWLYNNRNTVKQIPVLPEKLLRRYIQDESIVQEALSYWFVVWYMEYMPNRTFKQYIERRRIELNKLRWETRAVVETLRREKEFFKANAHLRYLKKINKFWEVEQKFTSYQRPVYMWTTTRIFNEQWCAFFDQNYTWMAPYLVLDTNKANFTNKLMKFWLKDIVFKLKQINTAALDSWIDEDFNVVESSWVEVLKQELFAFLQMPFKEYIEDGNEDWEDNEIEAVDW